MVEVNLQTVLAIFIFSFGASCQILPQAEAPAPSTSIRGAAFLKYRLSCFVTNQHSAAEVNAAASWCIAYSRKLCKLSICSLVHGPAFASWCRCIGGSTCANSPNRCCSPGSNDSHFRQPSRNCLIDQRPCSGRLPQSECSPGQHQHCFHWAPTHSCGWACQCGVQKLWPPQKLREASEAPGEAAQPAMQAVVLPGSSAPRAS